MALGTAVLVPLINPASAPRLVRLAAALAAPDAGRVVPVTVVPAAAGPADLEAARHLVVEAEACATAAGVAARGVVAVDDVVARGVLDAAAEEDATLVVIGWRGESTHRNVFGELIDSIVGRSSVPLAIVRLCERDYERVLLPVSEDHLLPAGDRGVRLAVQLVERLRAPARDVLLLRTGVEQRPLPAIVERVSDRVHHDPRRVDIAVRAAATVDDLIVVPVAPTVSGLRTATTHLAWAVPETSLLVAVDVGPPPTRSLARAVRRAGRRPPAPPPEEPAKATVTVRARFPVEGDDEELLALLGRLGTVEHLPPVEEEAGRWVRARVTVEAADGHAAVSAVMIAVHESPAFRGAEIAYELEPSDRPAPRRRDSATPP